MASPSPPHPCQSAVPDKWIVHNVFAPLRIDCCAWTMLACTLVKWPLFRGGGVRYDVTGPHRLSGSHRLHFLSVAVVVVSKDKEKKAQLYFSSSSSSLLLSPLCPSA